MATPIPALDPHPDEFIQRQVASGRYGSAADVMRAALRLLEDRDNLLREFLLEMRLAQMLVSAQPRRRTVGSQAQIPLTSLAGTGRGLWGPDSRQTIRELKDEWER